MYLTFFGLLIAALGATGQLLALIKIYQGHPALKLFFWSLLAALLGALIFTTNSLHHLTPPPPSADFLKNVMWAMVAVNILLPVLIFLMGSFAIVIAAARMIKKRSGVKMLLMGIMAMTCGVILLFIFVLLPIVAWSNGETDPYISDHMSRYPISKKRD